MLERLLELQWPLTLILVDPVLTPKKDHQDLLLKEWQWALAKGLVELLQPFEYATTILSGQKYVTLSLLLPVVSHLATFVDEASHRADLATVRKLAEIFKNELDQKFQLSKLDSSDVAVLSSALDPRFRDLKFMELRQRQRVRQEVLHAAKEQYGLSSDEREAVLEDLQGLPPKRL